MFLKVKSVPRAIVTVFVLLDLNSVFKGEKCSSKPEKTFLVSAILLSLHSLKGQYNEWLTLS